MDLREYQQTCLDGVHDALVDHQRVLLESPTGSGKTVMAAWMCRAVAEIGERAYFVCHRRELVQQTVQTFDRVGLESGVIAGGWSERPGARIQVASVQTLTRRTEKVPAPHLLIIDECLPPDSLVATPNGPRRIDSLRVGDVVLGMRDGRVEAVAVKHVFERPRHSAWITIDGVRMTVNHPVWTPRGWLRADEVKVGDDVCWLIEGDRDGVEVRAVREIVHEAQPREEGAPVLQQHVRRPGAPQAPEADHLQGVRRDIRGEEGPASLLLGAMSEDWVPSVDHPGAPAAEQRVDALAQSTGRRPGEAPGAPRERLEPVPWRDGCRDPRAGDGDPAGDGVPDAESRQRARTDRAAIAARRPARVRLDDGASDPDREAVGSGVAHLLQGGHRPPSAQDRDRVRRALAQGNPRQGGGRKAGRASHIEGMDRPALLEPRDSRGDRSGADRDRVFNLETESGNYFAGGLLVHNCHHTAAKSYSHLIDSWPDAFVVGLSATPCRLDGRGLDDWFHDLVLGPSVAELIEDGWLSRYRLFAPAAPDLAGVRTRAGDYATKELAEAMDRRDLIGDLLEHYAKHARSRKTIVFATNCAHSRHIVDRFNAGGVSAVHLDANTPTSERAAALRQFALGRYDVISNVELFGEGFDLAANAGLDCTVEAVISARPTQSVAIWLQQCGRALRPKAEAAIILDHAGNALRHGLPDDPRDWTLEGRRRTRKEVDDQVVPVRRCPECFNVHRREIMRCPACDHAYRVAQAPAPIKETGGELVEMEHRRQMLEKRHERQRVGMARTYAELYALGVERGYKKPASWAKHIIAARQTKRTGVGA